jgi:hypothetical protein
MKNVKKTNQVVVETLEARTMMSASPLTITQVVAGNGTELRIAGTAGNDKITLKQTSAGLLVGNNGFSQTITGTFADIKVSGLAGNDSILVDSSVQTNCVLYGGAGRNTLQAGSGNDILVSIGSTADTLIGGSGNDSFWTDATPAEKITNLRSSEAGNVHRVGSFYAPATATKAVKAAAAAKKASATATQPATTNNATYADFSNNPLFSSAGPSENDIYQGQIGDCFFLSVLSSVAKIDSAKINQTVLDMGDGTYLVQFSKGTSNVFVHVDGQLPVLSNGQLDYAGLGAQGSIWVAIVEKAYASFRGTTSSYASINGGWMSESYSALGESSSSFYGGTGATALVATIQSAQAAGQSVTYGTVTVANGAPLIAGHAYTVDAVNVDGQGNVVSVRLRNPWGVDGAGNDGHNDGYVTVTAQQLYASMAGIVTASV